MSGGRRHILIAVVAGASVFGAGAWWVRREQARAVGALVEASRPEPAPAPLEDVARAVRSLKLVTVEIDTVVTVERGDESWRGDVSAKVRVPVKLMYGTDLAAMKTTDVTFTRLLGARGAYVVRVPSPTRIATEVMGEKEETDVRTGWLRTRSRAGEYYLGRARRDAPLAAREMELLPEDAARVRRVTQEQVAALIRSVVGPGPEVRVVVEGGDPR